QRSADFAPDTPNNASDNVYADDVYSDDVYSDDVYSDDVYSDDADSDDAYSDDVYTDDSNEIRRQEIESARNHYETLSDEAFVDDYEYEDVESYSYEDNAPRPDAFSPSQAHETNSPVRRTPDSHFTDRVSRRADGDHSPS